MVERLYSGITRNQKKWIDLQWRMYYNQQWSYVSRMTSIFLDWKDKEQKNVCFYKGAIYQCTYNQDGIFSHAQLPLWYGVPQKIDPDKFWRIKMLVPPPISSMTHLFLTLTYQKNTNINHQFMSLKWVLSLMAIIHRQSDENTNQDIW